MPFATFLTIRLIFKGEGGDEYMHMYIHSSLHIEQSALNCSNPVCVALNSADSIYLISKL